MQIHDEGQFLSGLRGGHLDFSRPGVVSLLAPALYDRDCRGGAGGSRVGDGRAGGAWGRGSGDGLGVYGRVGGVR